MLDAIKGKALRLSMANTPGEISPGPTSRCFELMHCMLSLAVDLPQFAVLFWFSDDVDVAASTRVCAEGEDDCLFIVLTPWGCCRCSSAAYAVGSGSSGYLAVLRSERLLPLGDALLCQTEPSLVRQCVASPDAQTWGLEDGFE